MGPIPHQLSVQRRFDGVSLANKLMKNKNKKQNSIINGIKFEAFSIFYGIISAVVILILTFSLDTKKEINTFVAIVIDCIIFLLLICFYLTYSCNMSGWICKEQVAATVLDQQPINLGVGDGLTSLNNTAELLKISYIYHGKQRTRMFLCSNMPPLAMGSKVGIRVCRFFPRIISVKR